MKCARSLALFLATGLATFAPGCSGESDVATEVEESPGEGTPGSPDSPQSSDAVAGSYQLVTEIDLGSNAFASDDLIELLDDIRQAPITTTILAGAEELGIDPDAIAWFESVLAGMLPESFTDALDQLAANIDEALGSFELVTVLEVDGAGGPWPASHTVTGINVSFAGVDAAVDTSARAEIAEAFLELADGEITVSEHSLPVPVGEAIAQILDTQLAQSISPGASSLADALSTAADCAGLPDAWIGDADRLRNICTAGTAKLADSIAAALDNLGDLDVDMTLAGAAGVSDEDGDGAYDILSGSWGQGDDALPFEGLRM